MNAEAETYSNYFNLTKVSEHTVRSDPPHNATYSADRAFGGLIVSQAVNSFHQINPDLAPHTVNYKFISAGDYYFVNSNPAIPLHFKLTTVDDSKVARVFFYQGDKHVGMCHVQFTNKSELLDSSNLVCPDYGPPSIYPDRQQSKITRNVISMIDKIPLELRPIESPICPLSEKTRASYWMRIKPECQNIVKPADGLVVLLFISDFAILQVAEEIYLKAKIKMSTAASLHHAVWIHDADLDPYGWYLTVSECNVISYGRVRLESRIFNENQKCVMTVLQEGYIQRRVEQEKPKM